jgi:hypothetical protein
MPTLTLPISSPATPTLPALILGTRPRVGAVISVDLARALRDAGLSWTPRRGDRFIVLDKDMDEEVFVLSDMTIELHEYPGGPVFGFNGTTEWALDSLEQSEALWLPGEHQLRDELGVAFDKLERTEDGYRVHTHGGAPGRDDASYTSATAADAYALALLDHLGAFPRAV